MLFLLALTTFAFAKDPQFEGIHPRAALIIGGSSNWAQTQKDEPGSSGFGGGVGGRGTLSALWIPHLGLPLVTEGEIRFEAIGALGGAAKATARGGLTVTTAPRGTGLGIGPLFQGDARASFDYFDAASHEVKQDENGKEIQPPDQSTTSSSAAILAGAGPALTHLSRDTVLILQPWIGYGASGMRHDWPGGEDRYAPLSVESENHTSGLQAGGRFKYTTARGVDLNLFYGQSEIRTDLQASFSTRFEKDHPLTFEAATGAQFLAGKTYAPEETDRKGNGQAAFWLNIGFGATW